MMTATYDKIATTTLSSATTTVTFSSITSLYTDLVLITVANGATSGDDMWIRLNGDSGTNYSTTYFLGNGSSPSTGRRTNFNRIMADVAYPQTGVSYNQITHFMSYSKTSINKTVLMRASTANQFVGISVGLWRNTAAINQIDLTIAGSGLQFATGSTFTLYGIKAE